jgi:formylglycine-generating enzyme required for sulfatase activity
VAARDGQRYELFVVHADADVGWVRGYLLPALGLPEERVITSDTLEPGAALVDEFERAVRESRRTLLVLTAAFLADEWATFGRQIAAYAAIADGRARLIPLQLQPVELPLSVVSLRRLDYTRTDSWDEQTALLRRLLGQEEPPPERPRCPYPGMIPFGPDDSERFFGREQEIQELYRRVRRQRLLFVIGPSGSGKSSLIRAGLVPELERREPGSWVVGEMRPGVEPLQAMAAALGCEPEDLDRRGSLHSLVMAALARRPGARRLLLVVDQGEEAMAQAPEPKREAFFTALKRLTEVDASVVVVAFRADFFPDLMASSMWPVAPAQRLEVAPLRGDALRAAIERPASAVGVYLDARLVDRLLTDARGQAGALPLLQETLVLLWGRRPGRLLSLSAYEELGLEVSGMAVALAVAADASLAELGPPERRIARRIFVRLVHFGEGGKRTRWQQPVVALRATGDDPAAFDRTLQHLVDGRLLTVADEQPSGRVVDLSHDAIIEAWPTLREWLDAWEGTELVRRRLERDAQEWKAGGQDGSLLYRGRRLRQAAQWRAGHPEEPSQGVLEFLAASSTRRWVSIALRVAAGLLVVVLAINEVRALTAVQRENQWREAARADGPMASIPAGIAVLGGLEEGPRAARRTLSAFSIDRHEVANREYLLCVRAGRCSPPNEPATSRAWDQPSRRLLPVVWVNAAQAAAYCRWLGRRLPTASEWERAARGPRGRLWPWGAEPPQERHANLGFEEKPALARVDDPHYAEGATPEGIRDLVGNAWEWTSTPGSCEQDPYGCPRSWDGQAPIRSLLIRGNGFEDGDSTSITEILSTDASERQADVGFRCAMSG